MATVVESPIGEAAKRWWIPVLIGLLAIAAGILALAYPDITLLVLGLILGIYVVTFGVFSLVAAFEPGASTGAVVLRIVVGMLAILAGLVLIVRPGASVLAVLLAFGLWLIIAGVGDLVRGIEVPRDRFLSILLGLVSIAAGIIVLADPDIGLSTLAILAGILLLVRGTFELLLGFELHRLYKA